MDSAYAELLANPNVDAVYIATPHNFHATNLRQCLESGKAVLREKPLTLNATLAGEMISLAREKNLFLMKAMWTRFLPAIVNVRDLIGRGAIGDAVSGRKIDPIRSEHCLARIRYATASNVWKSVSLCELLLVA